ncbi:MAG: electron transport complex subunit RsxG [Halioglobus sp.]
MLGRSISRNSLLLALFAVVTTLLIAGTYLQTRDRIALSQRQAEERALLEIIPAGRHNNSMLDDTLPIGAGTLGLREDKQIYLARQNGETIAVIIPATASDGYSGDIDMIIGVNRDGSVAGVRVLSHKETPGLGDKVDLKKSDWILDFNGRSLTNPDQAEWAVKKDKGVFDQFTGATITPRAVVGTTLNVLQYAKAQHETLFANEAANGSTGEQ